MLTHFARRDYPRYPELGCRAIIAAPRGDFHPTHAPYGLRYTSGRLTKRSNSPEAPALLVSSG